MSTSTNGSAGRPQDADVVEHLLGAAGSSLAFSSTGSDADRAVGKGSSHATEPPVVARLVVEIRSDGTTTIARGGITDVANAHTAVIEARGSSPLGLALDLARHLAALTKIGPRAARALLSPKKRP